MIQKGQLVLPRVPWLVMEDFILIFLQSHAFQQTKELKWVVEGMNKLKSWIKSQRPVIPGGKQCSIWPRQYERKSYKVITSEYFYWVLIVQYLIFSRVSAIFDYLNPIFFSNQSDSIFLNLYVEYSIDIIPDRAMQEEIMHSNYSGKRDTIQTHSMDGHLEQNTR